MEGCKEFSYATLVIGEPRFVSLPANVFFWDWLVFVGFGIRASCKARKDRGQAARESETWTTRYHSKCVVTRTNVTIVYQQCAGIEVGANSRQLTSAPSDRQDRLGRRLAALHGQPSYAY
jgi:hypothetical protein